MKKLIFLFSVVVLILSSCSKSDNTQQNENPLIDTSNILIKKIIETVSGVSVTSTFTYNGKKLVSISNSNNTIANYTYTGDLITGLDFYSGATLSQKDTYTYNANNQITTYIRLNYGVNAGNKIVFTHNSDGTISFIEYFGDLTTQTTLNESGKLFFLNGEIIKVERYVGTTTTLSSTTNYAYDDKNHPFKNILGYDKTSFLNGNPKGISHNFLSRTSSSQSSTFNYTYDTNGFPINETKTYSGNSSTKQYFY